MMTTDALPTIDRFGLLIDPARHASDCECHGCEALLHSRSVLDCIAAGDPAGAADASRITARLASIYLDEIIDTVDTNAAK